jgi:hypothetical protein
MVQTGTPPSKNLAAASRLTNPTNTSIDVVNDYPWTLSRNRDVLNEVPHIYLKEFEINEGVIQQQINFYSTALNNATQREEDATNRGNTDPLSPYEGLYQGIPNGNWYRFPYFSEVNFQIETPVWPTLDSVEQGKRAASSTAGLLFGKAVGQGVSSMLDMVGNAYSAGLATAYPKVGIMDRPRLWERHEFRTIEIKFPLFNTLGPDDWKANRGLCWMLVNQNLFRKRDFITGIPPVYYEILIPGQHYSLAACVTNLVIYNRGNMRRLFDGNTSVVVPDVYEINMTLTDMTMPSRNLFQAVNTLSKDVTVNFINRTPDSSTNAPAENAQGFRQMGIGTNQVLAGEFKDGLWNVAGGIKDLAVDAGTSFFNSIIPGR